MEWNRSIISKGMGVKKKITVYLGKGDWRKI